MSEKMRAIILEKYDSNLVNAFRNLKVIEKDIPKPNQDEILIQVEASPINPSDIAFIRGDYNIVKPLPTVVGFECSGLVIDSGKSEKAQKLLGKRVSCFTQDQGDGTWAEYFIGRPENCIVLKDEMDIDQAGCLFINPFTAYALFQLIFDHKAGSFIQNAASGQIGQFLISLAKRENIPCINIVRKEAHIEKLKGMGVKYVLNSTSPDFQKELTKLSSKLNATLAFDAVGGDATGKIINAMPNNSTLYVYGGLSGQQICGIEILPMIFKGKTIKGFNLNDWKDKVTPKQYEEVTSSMQDMIIKGDIQTTIQRSIRLEDFSRGMILYISRMSNGKVLIKPQEK